jgi:modulator of drug activity B
MNILLIKANQALYASKGVLNEALFQMSCNILGEHHQIQVTDTATGLWDVNDEIHKLKRADAIVYHFPLWWFGLPHLLKNYEVHLKSIDWQSTTPVDGTGDS